jgi:anaerobic selenocysteine-containing dehydrogenase
MSKRLTRREFLKVSAAGAAVCVVSGCSPGMQREEFLESYIQPPEEGLPGENLWYASTCRECLAGCGIIVRSSEGRARKIEGNPLHPLNQGKLCARGQAALQDLWDPDRLRNAVQQVGRGTQHFEPLYWDDALARLSAQLKSADPASVTFLGGNLSTHLWQIVSRFVGALGGRTPVVYTLGDELTGQQTQVQASEQLFGSAAVPLYDIGQADAVFSFGANFVETWLSPVYYGRAYGRMRRGPLGRRGYLVQFESRLSSTATSADRWVPVRPGSEGLVALGLGKIIVEEGLAGPPPDPQIYEQVDLGAVAEASGVHAEELEILARTFAGAASPVAVPGGGVTGQQNSAQALAAVQALNALTNQLGQPGGVYLSAPPAGEAFTPAPLSTYAEVSGLIDDMSAGRVQILLIHGGDPVFALPPAQGFADALANVPFVVSFNSAVDETAAQSDLILPDHTTMEGWGYYTPALTDRMVVSSQQPIMRPLYDTRATVDVLLAAARELGGQVAQALPWPNEVDFVQETVESLNDGSVSAEAFWSEWRRRGGYWSESEELQSPSASGGFESAVNVAATGTGGEEAEYPYYLHIYPSIALFDGRGANKSWLQETPDPMTTVSWQTWIEINSHTAEELGVDYNDIVRVISPAGEVEALVYVYPGIGEDVVAMPIGRGHTQYGRFAAGKGSNPMHLLVPEVDDGTGGLVWGATRVRIEPTGEEKALARMESPAGVEYMLEGH